MEDTTNNSNLNISAYYADITVYTTLRTDSFPNVNLLHLLCYSLLAGILNQFHVYVPNAFIINSNRMFTSTSSNRGFREWKSIKDFRFNFSES